MYGGLSAHAPNIFNSNTQSPKVYTYILGLSNYRDSMHYRDSLTLFINKTARLFEYSFYSKSIVNLWDTYQLYWQKFSERYKT